MIASQLSRYCDIISNRLWRHQLNENRARKTRGRCVNIVVFIVFCGFTMSCKKWNNVYTLVTNCFCVHSSDILVLISLELSNSGNKYKSSPLVSAETVRHASTYIILYLHRSHENDFPGSYQYHIIYDHRYTKIAKHPTLHCYSLSITLVLMEERWINIFDGGPCQVFVW